MLVTLHLHNRNRIVVVGRLSPAQPCAVVLFSPERSHLCDTIRSPGVATPTDAARYEDPDRDAHPSRRRYFGFCISTKCGYLKMRGTEALLGDDLSCRKPLAKSSRTQDTSDVGGPPETRRGEA
jgi:hypothetical protein